MTKEQEEQYAKDLEQFAEWRKDDDDKKKLKDATLKKLGLTADEVSALLS
jgi:hypothetical protein